MWLRIREITLPAASAEQREEERERLFQKVCKMLRIERGRIKELRVYRKSPDLRKREKPLFVYTVDAELSGRLPSAGSAQVTVIRKPEDGYAEYIGRLRESVKPESRAVRPVVAGFGPAGIFAALLLAEAGLSPIVVERGRQVEERIKDVALFQQQNRLDPESNIQFGEGGAGTFSDGKLNSLIREKDTTGRFVLETFVKFGAPEEILYRNKPHIGTDNLRKIVKNIREYLIGLGAEIRFGTRLDGIADRECEGGRRVSGALLCGPQGRCELETDCIILAIGHSARDTFAWLKEREIAMERKAFSVGLRIEHLQSDIDAVQYGASARLLRACWGPADYKLSHQTSNGRGVYTFCMCPGGVVVGAASEQNGLVTNGMSNYDRAGRNANSALLVSVFPEDFPGTDGRGVSAQAGARSVRTWRGRLESAVSACGRLFGGTRNNGVGRDRADVLKWVPSCGPARDFTGRNLRIAERRPCRIWEKACRLRPAGRCADRLRDEKLFSRPDSPRRSGTFDQYGGAVSCGRGSRIRRRDSFGSSRRNKSGGKMAGYSVE